MGLFDRVKDLAQGALSSGQEKVNELKEGQRRKGLLAELGELTYDRHRGIEVGDDAIAAVLARLDELDVDDEEDPADESADTGDDRA